MKLFYYNNKILYLKMNIKVLKINDKKINFKNF